MSEREPPTTRIPYRRVGLAELERLATDNPAALPYLIAVKFNYDVKQGGFAQMLYNLQGEFLHETDEMLAAAGARVAHGHYVRAVRICLANRDEYLRFLSSGFTDTNVVKEALQLLSVEYLTKRIDFVGEAAAFLTMCPKP